MVHETDLTAICERANCLDSVEFSPSHNPMVIHNRLWLELCFFFFFYFIVTELSLSASF
jgi:hypothetical protein